MKLPNYLTQHLAFHNWQPAPDGSYVKQGTALYIRCLSNSDFAVQLIKMSHQWNNLVTSEELFDIIRSMKVPPTRSKNGNHPDSGN